MVFRVRIADPAVDEFERTVAYVAVILGQPSAAAALADEFEEKLGIPARYLMLFMSVPRVL